MGEGFDGFGSTESGAQPAPERAQRALALDRCLGADPQDLGGAVVSFVRLAPQAFASGDARP